MPGWATWALWGLASYQQGYDGLAKQDTLYLASDNGAGISDLAVDRSQYLDNQTASATWTSEAAPATRFNLSNQWCFEFDFDADNADTGRFFQYDCVTAASDLSLRLRATGLVDIIINGGAAATTLTLPGISGSNQQFVLQWSAMPNPDTTGASDALLHQLCAWNLDTGAFDKVLFSTVVRPTQTGAMVIWAGSTGGTNPFTGVPHGVRIGRRFHSATETAIDFVEDRAEPGTSCDTRSEHEGLPIVASSDFHSMGNFHGPTAVWAVDKIRRLTRRTLSPLYNKRFRNHPTWTDAELTGGNPKIRAAPGAPDYRMHLGWLQVAPVPDTCTHLWVRVHVFSRASSGAAVPVGVRFYSMNRPPGGVIGIGDGTPAEAFAEHHATEVIERDDEVGVTFGQWDIEALVPIARGASGIRKGKTYLAIALNVDPESASGNDAAAQLIVRACHAVPCLVTGEGGGVPYSEVG